MSPDDSLISPASGVALRYPFDAAPPSGGALEVAPGVLWMRLPLPGSLLHVNVWAIEDGDGWAIVDTGLFAPGADAQWEALLAGPLGGRPVTRVLVTHLHADHVGMAGWLTQRFGCALWMTRVEYLTCRSNVANVGREAPPDGVRFYRRAGWDEAAIGRYRTQYGRAGRMVYALPDSFRRLEDGARLRIGENEWQVVVGRGHTPEHACLYCPALRVLVSGDQVLPRISSNVSVHPIEPHADPLGEWLESIAKLNASLPADVLVLPAHNEPFIGLHQRLERLVQGVMRGIGRLHARLCEPRRAVDLFGTLFAKSVDSNDLMHYTLATGEAMAFLNFLVTRNEARVHCDSHGVLWYAIACDERADAAAGDLPLRRNSH
ncbi:MBL fold metallo-hydrolase [Caballeronia sp. LZ025]|uniref:MBL fold metallo-hydrolase n=1 Tax=Caballeronia TaxID=1827195 RepID=UPI001FD0F061|nr:MULTISPECIES: MBL fold metallo-hydrolase [Caballeronia]MDR5734331.1 MBL fold metallo-hydrolase [Caballeronia sp. LZ025]